MNYQNGIVVAADGAKLFEAITTTIDSWWGRTDLTRSTKQGDTFSVFFENDTKWKFKVVESIKDKKVVWECIEAYHKIEGMNDIEKEWLGSRLIWRLESMTNNETLLVFEHEGLTPTLNCYEVCNNGWNYFLKSLKKYAETGIGTPNIVK